MWKIISSKEVFTHKRLSLVEDEVELPDGTRTDYLKFKDDGHCAATVIARREDGLILVSKEYSYPPNDTLYQFPGGEVPAGESPEIGANRELMEEAGYRAGTITPLGWFYINNRRSAAKMHVFLAGDLVPAEAAGDPEEKIESFWFTEPDVDRLIAGGEIKNAFFLAAWNLYLNRCDS